MIPNRKFPNMLTLIRNIYGKNLQTYILPSSPKLKLFICVENIVCVGIRNLSLETRTSYFLFPEILSENISVRLFGSIFQTLQELM